MPNAPSTTARRSQVEVGMLLMAAAMLAVPGNDAIAKLLSASLAPGMVAWGRFVFQTTMLLPVAVVTRRRLGGQRLGLHAARGLLLAGAILTIFWALKYLPIANAIAIFFVEPLILTLMSAALLGEPIGWRRISAVGVGLLGAMIVIRPSWEAFGWAAILPLGTAFCFAGYLTLTRHMAGEDDPVVMQVWTGVFSTIILTVALLAGSAVGIPVLTATWPSAGQWAGLVVLGSLAGTTHVVLALAFRRAPAGVLAPFQYLEIISATLLGYLIFGDFPDALTFLGTGIIIASGLYVFHRERTLARRAPALSDQP
ncbi:DMT family transporter [Ferruginivarius sediminum]|uniref:DMT family transporter n=1 Tax=Ferruginivarius sediminum TaxID=2661937 RepID=A0A369TB16_9PROT|nr:DMT family transporter [Ferruginivarius sediminum]RDD62521.1 DMT family transporter [Ferruginivarius sediminum]